VVTLNRLGSATFTPAVHDATKHSDGYDVVQEEGVDLTKRRKVNFIGTTVTATDDGSVTVVTSTAAPVAAPYLTFGLNTDLTGEFSVSETDESTLTSGVDMHLKWSQAAAERVLLIENTGASGFAAVTVRSESTPRLTLDNIGDAFARVQLATTGLSFGPGVSALDTRLRRSAADEWTSDDLFRFAAGATLNASQTLRFRNPADTFQTTFVAGAQTGDLNYTWPTVAPTAGQVFTSTAAGVTSWTTVGGSATIQDEGTALVQRSIQNVISAIAQAGDNVASARTDFYVHARHYDAIVDSVQATLLESNTATSVTTTSLTRTGAGWGGDQQVSYRVVITNGAAAGQSRRITSQTGTDTINFATITGLSGTPTYEIIPDTNCFRRLRDAKDSGARSILFRTGVDIGTVTWAAADTLKSIRGDSQRDATISFVLSIQKSSIFLSDLLFLTGSQLYFNTLVTFLSVQNCVFDGLSGTAILIESTLALSQFFTCSFVNMTGAVLFADAAIGNVAQAVAFVGCTFDTCSTAARLIDTVGGSGSSLAVISCLFNECSNTTNLINNTADALQIVTANRFIMGASGPTTMVNLGGGRCQIIGNLVSSAGAETTLFNLTNDNSVNGNLVQLGDKVSGTHTGFNVQGRNNIAGNFFILFGKNFASTVRAVTLNARGNIYANNSFINLDSSVVGTVQVVNIVASARNWIIVGNSFVTLGSPGLTGINAGTTIGVLDANLWEEGGNGDAPGTWIAISAVSGDTKIGANNIGLVYTREEILRELIDHWESTSYVPVTGTRISNFPWTEVLTGAASTITQLAGAQRSAIRMTAGVLAANNAILDTRPANMVESATFGAGKIREAQFVVRMGQTINAKVWLGFWDAAVVTNANPTNFEGFFLDTGTSANWQFQRVVAGVANLTSTTIAVDTGWHVFLLRHVETTTGSIELWIDGVRRVNFAITAGSIPTADLTLGMKVLAIAAADNVTMDIDLSQAKVKV